MPATRRPVKLSCLPCRALKIRCDGQKPCSGCVSHREECRYQPSRRGGARRGPAAAEELAKKRAERQVNRSSVNHYDKEPELHSSIITIGSPVPLPPFAQPPVSPVESGLRPSSASLGDCRVGISSPLSGIAQEIPGSANPPTWTLRAYSCDLDLINAYYIFIHPYFPLLPPPAVAQYEDKCVDLRVRSAYADASNLPYWPTSPLGLALGAILTLIPPPGASHTANDVASTLRRSYADLFARSALESLEDSLEPSSHSNLADGPRSILHHAIPRKMEPVLAVALLSLYECCQRGNVSKMRVRANQALTSAMDLSLHKENFQTGCLDAHRRCWWAIMFLVYLSSLMNGPAPLITVEDSRISTMFPEFRGCREPWPLLVNAQAALLRSCCVGRELIRETKDLPVSIREEIQALDSLILDLAAEADRFRCVTNYQGAEAEASRNLWAISNALIHTSRVTLHRVRAFPDRPIFLDAPCDFLAVDAIQLSSDQIQDFHLSTGRIAELNSCFPFTQQESVRLCLHSSLVVSRVFRRMPSPNPMYSDTTADVTAPVPWTSWRPLTSPRSIPYMACCQLQSFYTLAMVLRRVRRAIYSGTIYSYAYLLDRPSAITEVQDAERLVEELQSEMEALGKSIKADVVFEGVGIMSRGVERVYEATMTD